MKYTWEIGDLRAGRQFKSSDKGGGDVPFVIAYGYDLNGHVVHSLVRLGDGLITNFNSQKDIVKWLNEHNYQPTTII